MVERVKMALARILLVVLLASLVLVSHGEARNTPSPGDQAKVAVSLDATHIGLTEIASYLEHEIKNLETLKDPSITAAKKGEHVSKFVKSAANINKLLSFFSVASAIFSVVSTFCMPSELDVIQEHFKVVNNKLDIITSQIEMMRNELKSSIEFNTWLTTYIEWEDNIQNGEAKLVETQNRLTQVEDERQRLRLMESYIDYFENQDIEGKAMKIYRLTALVSSTTRYNLFELYVKEKGCDVLELARLMFIIRNLMTSAGRQAVIYQFLKYGSVDYAREKMATFSNRLYEIRRQYELHIWYCKRDSVKYAKEEIIKMAKRHKQVSKEELSIIIYERLSDMMPWYDWAIVLYREAPTVSITVSVANSNVQISDKGGQFFTLEKVASNDDFNILAVWQDVQDTSYGCQDIADANTFVPFQAHPGSSTNVMSSSVDMVTGKGCLNHLADVVISKMSDPFNHSIISRKLSHEKYSFVAAGFSSPKNPCLSHDVCNDNGLCRHIPHTGKHLCLCHEYFEGDDCQEYHNPANAHNITDMVASLRHTISQFIGVPTVIDVYLNIKEIPQQLELVRQRIMNSIRYTQFVTLYGEVFSDAEYVTTAYNQLQAEEISEEIYNNRVKDINFHRIISDFKKAILGEGILVQSDFLSVYKKSIISHAGSQVACTQNYATSVSHMMTTLATLDHAVTEARLWTTHLRIQQMTVPEAVQTVENAKRVTEAAQRRRDEYIAFWEATSCPKLTTEDLQQRHCDVGHSYQGLQLSLTCNNQKHASPSSVSCTKRQDKMQWTATPQCLYEWGPWSSWSVCSKTCGGGRRTRRRTKPNGESSTSHEACNTQDCCQPKYGNFKCPNGNCIRRSYLCDGDNNCGDGSDEARSRCSYLRDGDTIALKNHCGGRGFLSCHCSVNGGQDCKTRDCPGSAMSGSDWKNCAGEKFNYITAVNRDNGDAIRYGDSIAIRYGDDDGDKGWWLSCSGSKKCTTRTCPGKHFSSDEKKCRGERFWIFAFNRQASCGTDTYSGCIGKPIYPGDHLYILYSPDYWLSGRNLHQTVTTRTCPGRHLTRDISRRCSCERWTVYRQRNAGSRRAYDSVCFLHSVFDALLG